MKPFTLARCSDALHSLEDLFTDDVSLGIIAVARNDPDGHLLVCNLGWADVVRALAETAKSSGIDPDPSETLRAIADEMSEGGAA